MVVSAAGWSRVDELKSVQVELPFEGEQSRLAKVQRNDLLEEPFGLVDGERPTPAMKEMMLFMPASSTSSSRQCGFLGKCLMTPPRMRQFSEPAEEAVRFGKVALPIGWSDKMEEEAAAADDEPCTAERLTPAPKRDSGKPAAP